jgi:hypothetical protein
MIDIKRIARLSACLFALSACHAAHADEQKTLYIPTSGWMVGPASLAPSDGGAHLPCVMMDQYDNGYTFRFSGGNKRILAAAIDFRQSVFTAGTHYPLTLEVPPSFSKKVDAAAYNEGILMITATDQQDAEDLYKALADGKEIHLGLGPRTINFSLLGVQDGLRRVEACYNPDAPAPQKNWSAAAAASPPRMEQPPAGPEIPAIDPEPEHVAAASPADAPVKAAPARAAIAPSAPKSADKIVDTQPAANPEKNWQATRGANLRDILDEWSRKQNVQLNWMATRNYLVKESTSVSGSFEQAVQSLIAQFSGEKNHPIARFYVDTIQKKPALLISEEGL